MSKRYGFCGGKSNNRNTKVKDLRYRGLSYKAIGRILKIPERTAIKIYEGNE